MTNKVIRTSMCNCHVVGSRQKANMRDLSRGLRLTGAASRQCSGLRSRLANSVRVPRASRAEFERSVKMAMPSGPCTWRAVLLCIKSETKRLKRVSAVGNAFRREDSQRHGFEAHRGTPHSVARTKRASYSLSRGLTRPLARHNSSARRSSAHWQRFAAHSSARRRAWWCPLGRCVQMSRASRGSRITFASTPQPGSRPSRFPPLPWAADALYKRLSGFYC